MRLTLLPSALTLLSILPSALAVFADEAYNIDYHHQLVGLPQPSTTFFHRPRKDEKASLLYTLSDLGIVAAVNPGTGALLWRQNLAANSNRTFGGPNKVQGFLRAAEGQGSVVSATGGYVNAWDAVTGREWWYNEFVGTVRDLEILEDVGGEKGKDVLVLTEETIGDGSKSRTVLRRLSAATGNVVWEYIDDSGDVPSQVSTNVQNVFVVTLHGARGGYTLKTTTLDPTTGNKVDAHTLSTKDDIHDPEDVLFVGANSAAPIVAWSDKGMKNLKVNILGTKNINTLATSSPTYVKSIAIHAPQLVQSQPHFLVHYDAGDAHWADVYHTDLKAGTVTKAYHLQKMSGRGVFSVGSQDANVYFARSTRDEVVIVSSRSHGFLSRWPISLKTGLGSDLFAVSEVVAKSSDSYAVRSAILTGDHDWTMIRNGALSWKRPEGLSGGVAASWAEIPEEEAFARSHNLQVEAHSNPLQAYIHRVKRHVNDLQYLPAYVKGLPKQIVESFLPQNATSSSDHSLVRDNFGFHKLVILATQRGRLYALDSGDQGRVVWTSKVADLPSDKRWEVKKITFHNAGRFAAIHSSNLPTFVAKITDGSISTQGSSPSHSFGQNSILVESSAGQRVLSVADDGKLSPLPVEKAPTEILVVQDSDSEVHGVMFKPQGEEAIPVTMWQFKPSAGQKILSITARSLHDPVASIGRVLGDRSVMYKYLNPNTVLVTAVSEFASTVSFYLLDSVSGEILHSTIHEGVDLRQPITSVISENWFVYSLWSDSTSGMTNSPSAKGYQVVVSDLYESSQPNDRGPLGDAQNFSSLQPSEDITGQPAIPHVITQAFIIPDPISHMAVTQTKQGIATRQILCTLPLSNSIVAIPRQLLDPRRPVGRDPTPAEAEEGLIRYAPVIEFSPQSYLNHQREVVGIREVLPTPSLLESTSLVFAYGVDVFGTRVAPSMAFDILGKGFNKVNLLLTVVALGVGVGVLAPMVCFFETMSWRRCDG